MLEIYCLLVTSCVYTVPSAPVDFVNVSRTATSVSFSWNSPTDVNGILQDYMVTTYSACFAVHDVCCDSSYICSESLNITVICALSLYIIIIIINIIVIMIITE